MRSIASIRSAVSGVVPGAALLVTLVLSQAAGAAAQTLTFTPAGTIPGPVDQVDIHGNLLFMVSEKTLTIYDVTNPAAPKKGGSYSFPEKIWGVRAVGPLLYVAADFFGLAILDISNPSTPVLRGSIKTPGQAKNVALVGTKALVADHMSGVDHIDVSDPAKPVNLGSFFLDGYARDVASSGQRAYAVDSPAGVYVFDFSRPGPFEPVGSVQSANATRTIELADIGSGKLLALMPGAGGHLQIYDVSTPASPVKVTAFKMPGPVLRVAVRNTHAYVADGREGMHVVDLSNAAQPSIVGAHKTAAPARDVAVKDGFVFVVAGALPQGNVHAGGGEVVILRQTP